MSTREAKTNTIIKNIFNEFVYGGHLLSLSDASVVLALTILLKKPISWPLLLITYLIPQVVYSFDHIKELKDDKETNPERAGYLEKTKTIYPLLAAVYLIILVLTAVVYSNIGTILLVIFIGVSGVLYPKSLTKKIVGFKNYYVGIISAIALSFLPFFYYNLSLNSLFVSLAVFAFLRLFLNTVYFDFKDYESDKKQGLKTLVVTLGKDKTVMLLSIINIISVLVIVASVLLFGLPSYALGLVLVAPYSFVYLFLANKLNEFQLRKISYLMVDGEYILWPLLILMFGSINK